MALAGTVLVRIGFAVKDGCRTNTLCLTHEAYLNMPHTETTWNGERLQNHKTTTITLGNEIEQNRKYKTNDAYN